MNCHDWQEIILTDYLDDQCDLSEQKRLEDHLLSCQACREFTAHARKTVIEPFKQAKMHEPPQRLWHDINEMINEEQSTGKVINLWNRIKDLIAIPKPAFAFAIVVIIIMGTTLIWNNQNQPPRLTQKQAEDIDYALEELVLISDENGEYEQTDIERYFL